jgi:hypothetical protein
MQKLLRFAILLIVVVAVVGTATYMASRYQQDVDHALPSPSRNAQKYVAADGVETVEQKHTRLREEAREKYHKGDIATPEAYAAEVKRIDTLRLKEIAAENGEDYNPSPKPQSNSAPTPAAQQSPTEKGIKLPTPEHSITNLAEGKWRVVLPGNEEYFTGIKILKGQTLIISEREGKVKLNKDEIYLNNPQGTIEVSKLGFGSATPKPFVSSTAWVGALLCRLGPDSQHFDVGGRNGSMFTVAEGNGELLLSVNTLADEKYNASGAYTFTVEVK